jgi:hypothetical protein
LVPLSISEHVSLILLILEIIFFCSWNHFSCILWFRFLRRNEGYVFIGWPRIS